MEFSKIYRFNSIEATENSDWNFINPDGTSGLSSAGGSSKRRWNWDNNTTSSSNVGPAGPVEGDGYIYTEASSPTKDKDVFSMSTTVDGSDGNVVFDMRYSADTDGDPVQLIVRAFNGKKMIKEFDKNIGGTNSDWKHISISLEHYAVPDLLIEISIVMTKGGSIWHKDVGIDYIRITGKEIETDTGMSKWLRARGMKGVHGHKKKEWEKGTLSSEELRSTIFTLEEAISNGDIVLDSDCIIIQDGAVVSHIIKPKG